MIFYPLKPENLVLQCSTLTWGRLDSTGMSGYELQVEVVWNLFKHRAKQTNANVIHVDFSKKQLAVA